ncbi:hypothetical protein acsn021_17950 [Anaerocolumna cellulosilytica]|uniref:Uncharacterized protein n=1 Tax=Anaerocolumna cellulosilytica TaxID=433286 RepID=A0A6S6QWX5_9FIRM|nr:hypothetical protein [Anaerocolumna cellulosilytica]MBB5194810.1 ribose/xylose/arabinose/galactoside ABC-type transport system permease subunit [Anaerocolumna cellulosilytica]BCJ94226.1 hypothetical protein acsn021_17950 [Anaerocolumna cellulosilytica]
MRKKVILQNGAITISMPMIMFLVMLFLTKANGIAYYGQSDMWRTIATNLGLTITMSCALAMQLRHGRFDFSGGANMILAGILGCYYTQQFGGSPLLMLVLCVVFSVALSLITATVYVRTKIPINICTIMMALIYEALTLVLAGGNGVNILNKQELNVFGKMPYTTIILVFAVIFYQVIISLTPFGRKAKLLRNGQNIAVNIGINEKKNVMYSYLCSGLLLGLAAVIYVSQNKVETQSNLSSTSVLFSYIASVYIGMFLGRLSLEIVGMLMGALTIQLMNYGLRALGYGSGGWNNVVFGIFMMTFWVISTNADQIRIFLQKFKKNKLNTE